MTEGVTTCETTLRLIFVTDGTLHGLYTEYPWSSCKDKGVY